MLINWRPVQAPGRRPVSSLQPIDFHYFNCFLPRRYTRLYKQAGKKIMSEYLVYNINYFTFVSNSE